MKDQKHYDLIHARMYFIFSGIMFAFREWWIAIGCLVVAVLWVFIYSVDCEVERGIEIMKHGKRLTVEMKKMLSSNGYNHKEYLYIKNTTNTVEFVNVKTGKIIMIEKGVD